MFFFFLIGQEIIYVPTAVSGYKLKCRQTRLLTGRFFDNILLETGQFLILVRFPSFVTFLTTNLIAMQSIAGSIPTRNQYLLGLRILILLHPRYTTYSLGSLNKFVTSTYILKSYMNLITTLEMQKCKTAFQ